MQYKHDDYTTAINLIDAQLEKINAQAVFPSQQDGLEMKRVLHSARVESGNGLILDLKLLLNLIGGIFRPDEEALENDESLQATLSAQVRKTNYENRGAAAYDRNGPKKNQDSKSPKPEPLDISKLMQLVFDMKAVMGSVRKAMTKAGISFDISPNKQK